jgi:hypothetical protein
MKTIVFPMSRSGNIHSASELGTGSLDALQSDTFNTEPLDPFEDTYPNLDQIGNDDVMGMPLYWMWDNMNGPDNWS